MVQWTKFSGERAERERGAIQLGRDRRLIHIPVAMEHVEYPHAVDPALVGTYSPLAKAGGGYVWDAVLEYRVWCHPERGAPDEEDGNDYYYAFATYAEALAFSEQTEGAEAPLALIQQLEFITETAPGVYVHVKEPRVTEWPVEFLKRPRRTENTIQAFLAPDAPVNRLDILRGIAVSVAEQAAEHD